MPVPDEIRCTKPRADGSLCPHRRDPGLDVCWLHQTRPQRRVRKRRMARVEMVRVTELAGRSQIDPAVAMLDMVAEAYSNVMYYGALVQALRPQLDGGAESRPVLVDEEGVMTVHPAYVGAGVAGRVDPENWKADPHVLVRMYNEERDRLVRYCKLARDAGVDERMVRAAEQHGRVVVRLLDAVLDALELTEDQRAALPAAVAGALDVIEAGG